MTLKNQKKLTSAAATLLPEVQEASNLPLDRSECQALGRIPKKCTIVGGRPSKFLIIFCIGQPDDIETFWSKNTTTFYNLTTSNFCSFSINFLKLLAGQKSTIAEPFDDMSRKYQVLSAAQKDIKHVES